MRTADKHHPHAQVARNRRSGVSRTTPYERISEILRGRASATPAPATFSSAPLPAYIDVNGDEDMPLCEDLYPQGYHAAGRSGGSGGARTRRRSLFVIDEARNADGDDDDDDDDDEDSEDDGQDSFVDDRDEAELTVDSE